MNYFKLSRILLYLSVFCVILVTNSTLFPFIVGKYVFFRAAVDLALIAFLLGVIFHNHEWEALKARAKKVFHHPLFIAVSIFTLAALLASLFAYDAAAAFWSNFERGEGGLQILHFYIFFTLLLLLFRTELEWRHIFKLSLVASGFVILYGLAASFQVGSFIGPAGLCGRFEGSLGNPAYLAPYLMFMMFYGLWLWFTKKRNPTRDALFTPPPSRVSSGSTAGMNGNLKSSPRGIIPHGKVWGFIVLMLAYLFFFLLSQTRGSFLGLGLAVITGLLYLSFALPKGKGKKISAILAGASIVFAGLAFAFRSNNIPLVPFCESSSRLLDVSISDQTAQTRFWTWGSAIKGFEERPLLGWGPENFSVVFDKYFDPRHYVPGQNSETWFDRAHSVFFDYLAETGIVGFLAFLGIYLTFFVEFVKRRKDIVAHHHPYGYVLTAGLLAIPVAYLGQGIALFDVLPIYLNVFLFLAFATHLFLEIPNSKHQIPSN